MDFIKLTDGCFWLHIKEANLRILCGVPPDVMKFLANKNLINSYQVNGFYAELGPNTILLSEDMHVGDMVVNLAEFPVLQMFYMQGMGLEFHPNFGKEKPLLIGKKDVLKRQLNYINAGNNGMSYVEMSKSEIKPNLVDVWFNMKAKFAGSLDMGSMIQTLELQPTQTIIKEGIVLERLEKNFYEIVWPKGRQKIDLRVPSDKKFEPLYKVKKRVLPGATFMVVNTGTGDGWNTKEPCFGSMVVHNDKYYLVDCEAFTLDNIKKLAVNFDDLNGIFMTHCHDDHMSGLPNFLLTGKKITLYCTLLVYRSIMLTVCALLNKTEPEFRANFPHYKLEYDQWNDVDGLEVIPFHSAHPVETSIFFFRVADGSGYKIYGHLGDIAPFPVIKKYRDQSNRQSEKDFYNKMLKHYLIPADLKKIDVGGGLIHGVAADFSKDTSAKIILGHYHRKLTSKETKIGKTQTFGEFDVLIP